MVKSYLKIAWRNISRKKLYTTINVMGLALGVCSGLAIYTIISYELGFDTFHPDKERIYRVIGDVTESTGDLLHFARVPPAVALNSRAEISGFETIAGLIPYSAEVSIPNGEQPDRHFPGRIAGTHYLTIAITEPQYFDIFRYEWLAGTPDSALDAPFSVVLTENRARLYFGSDPLKEMIGRQVIYEDSLKVSVSGIIKDWEQQTDLAFTDFISFSTLQSSFLRHNFSLDAWNQRAMSAWVFTKLAPGAAPAFLNTQLTALVRDHADAQTKLALWLEPLSDIHFNADIIENPIRTAHMKTLYSLLGIALFILVLAIINFINLSTALSILRAKEVGVRKVLGSRKSSLIFQFLTETFLLTALAVVPAVALVNPILAAFRAFIPDGVSFDLLQPSTLFFLSAVTTVTAVAAGLYPATVLSSYLPVLSLKGSGAQRGTDKWLLRKGLIVFQFTVSLVFIIASLVIADQLRFTREKDLGFTADAILTIDTPWGDSLSKIQTLEQQLRQIPGVGEAARQWLPPMNDNPRGMKLKFNSTDRKDFWVGQVAGDENFIPLYEIDLLSGRNLLPADRVKELVINESLSKLMGNEKPEDAIGKTLYWNDEPYPVVGVVADFHINSLHQPLEPLCVINRPDRQGSLAVKLNSKGRNSDMIQSTLAQIEKSWKQIYPAGEFSYRFYDDSLAVLYEKDRQTATLVNTAMGIAILISCIGLFGITLFTAQKRSKEISIRKILGAGVAQIAALLSREFVVLVLVALLLAAPPAWYLANMWLSDFAYHIQVGWWVFVLAGAAAIAIALVTISWQVLRAALANPVENLRSE